MADIAQGMRFKIDLDAGLVQRPQREILMRNDKNANKVIIEVTRGRYMEPVRIDGVGVTGKFTRQSGIVVPLTGSASGNVATVLLDEHCYVESGSFKLTIKLTVGSAQRTVLYISGNVERDADGPTVDIENVIPSVDDIIAMISEMRQVTAAAQRATADANNATKNANTAAAAANDAAVKINNMTVSANSLAEGKAPTATVSETGGHKHIAFGIPQGKTGTTPRLTIGTVTTGAPGTSAAATITGTVTDPVLNLTIPKGQGDLAPHTPVFGFITGTVTLGYQGTFSFPQNVPDGAIVFLNTNIGIVTIVSGTISDVMASAVYNPLSDGVWRITKRIVKLTTTQTELTYNGLMLESSSTNSGSIFSSFDSMSSLIIYGNNSFYVT